MPFLDSMNLRCVHIMTITWSTVEFVAISCQLL